MLKKHDTIAAAHGRWREILVDLGVEARFLTGKQTPCPLCGGEDRFCFSNRTGEGDYVCRRCGGGKGFQLAQKHTGEEFKPLADKIDRIVGNLPPPKLLEKGTRKMASVNLARELWRSSSAITPDDPVGRYLTSRCCPIGHPKVLRYVPELQRYEDKTVHPGMIAFFSNGKSSTLHRTYLTFEGKKADFTPNRMFMGGSIPDGGAIPLGDAAQVMGVAEGIETALSAALMFNMPVWATTSEGALQKFVPPPTVRFLTIFADNDRNYVGQAAAMLLAKRLMLEAQKSGRDIAVVVSIATVHGADWNDVLMKMEAKANAA